MRRKAVLKYLLKSIVWGFIIGPFVWMVVAIILQKMGGDPIKEIQHFTGLIAIRFMLTVLLIAPVVMIMKWTILNSIRRLVGLAVFFWATLHISSYLVLELSLDWRLFLSEIVSRNYLILGAVAWFGLLLLTLTSNQYMMRYLKQYWKKLHYLVYPIAMLIAIHYYLSLKISQIYPLLYLGGFIVLCIFHGYRHYDRNVKRRLVKTVDRLNRGMEE